MNQSQIKIDVDIADVLCDPGFDRFTVTELRNAYWEKSSVLNLSKIEARRTVYRQILRLLKHGLLEKISSSENCREHRYQKTEHFRELAIEKKVPLSVNVTDSQDYAESTSSSANDSLKQQLLDRLQGYRVDLLTSLGESEEYEALYEAFPELKSELQSRYDSVRDQSSKILGKVKALEALIAVS
ncbi:hypothetical protein ONV78_17765 [Hahella sp. CR1]|uniref:hypothetical protein n=1 Tax=Hahella sp. CR1 TaxID=2992807 RepID=UPI0024419171|nr:hypothetical protein [Hahella sp. CR1]MDG9669589.1 hypothetical protein [Hahella sp. CR1]